MQITVTTVSWAGPSPGLCKRRPTANLVSRKVLVPLLGQMAIAVAIQAIVYIAVMRQSWYVASPAVLSTPSSSDTTVRVGQVHPAKG